MGIQINGQTDTISAVDGSITVATDLTVPGALTYDDVTNIDSVGVITARSGLNVTGGSVGIGTDNPGQKLDVYNGNISLYAPTHEQSIRLRTGRGTLAELVHLSGDGALRLYTGEVTPILRTYISSYGNTYFNPNAGNVGIGVTNPDLTLHVNGVNALPSTSGSTPTGHLTLRSKAQSSSHGMFMGVSNASPWSSWIQAQDANNNATNYPLLLNPNGGNVGIGTDNVDYKLEVFGAPGADGDFSIKSSASAADGTEHSKLRFRVRNPSNQESTLASIHVESSTNWGGNLIFGTKTASGGLSESTVERLRITSDGKMGLGTQTPGQTLSISGSSAGLGIYNTGNNHGNVYFYKDGTAKGWLKYRGDNDTLLIGNVTDSIHVATDGDVAIGGATPVDRLTVYNSNSGNPTGITIRNTEASSTYSHARLRLESQNGAAYAHLWADVANTALRLGYNSSSTVNIKSDGSLGVGIMDPSQAKLVAQTASGMSIAAVKDNTGASISLGGVTQPRILMEAGASASEWKLYTAGGSSYGSASWTERLRVASDGKLIHGVNSSSYDLTTAGNGYRALLIGSTSGSTSALLLDGASNGDGSGSDYASIEHNSGGEMRYKNRQNSGHIFYTTNSDTERFRITSDGHLVYDTNKGGIYNFDKACSANASTNIFRIDNEHGAHCFTIYMTGSNSGNSVSKIYNVACQFGSNPTISSAADTGGYSSNNFSLTGSVSGKVHTFAISVTGAAATISCTVVLGSMTTGATVTVL